MSHLHAAGISTFVLGMKIIHCAAVCHILRQRDFQLSQRHGLGLAEYGGAVCKCKLGWREFAQEATKNSHGSSFVASCRHGMLHTRSLNDLLTGSFVRYVSELCAKHSGTTLMPRSIHASSACALCEHDYPTVEGLVIGHGIMLMIHRVLLTVTSLEVAEIHSIKVFPIPH